MLVTLSNELPINIPPGLLPPLFLAAWQGACFGGVARCCLERVASLFVVLVDTVRITPICPKSEAQHSRLPVRKSDEFS